MGLLDRVAAESNLLTAWEEVRKQAHSLGLPRRSVQEFERRLGRNLRRLAQELREESYIPQAAEQRFIPKGKGKELRAIQLTVALEDRIVQVALRSVIEPILEKVFRGSSFAYRPGRGPQRAIRRLRDLIARRKPTVALKSDIDDFFDTLDQELLLETLDRHLGDRRTRDLIELFVKGGVVTSSGKYRDAITGVPTGGLLSPLLSNLYLHSLDCWMADQDIPYVRFADDFVCLLRDQSQAAEIQIKLSSFLQQQLHLRLNADSKNPYGIRQGVPFLGYQLSDRRIQIDPQKFRVMQGKLDGLAHRVKRQPENAVVARLAALVRGWKTYYKLTEYRQDWLTLEAKTARLLAQVLGERQHEGRLATDLDLGKLLAPLPMLCTDREAFIADLRGRLERHRARLARRAAAAERTPQQQKQQEESPPSPKTEGRSSASPGKASGPADRQPGTAGRRLARQRRMAQRAYARSAELVIWDRGASIGRTADRLVVRLSNGRSIDRAIRRVRHLMVKAESVVLTARAIRLCADNDVPITFMDSRGGAYCVLVAPSTGRFHLMRAQIEAAQGSTGRRVAEAIIHGKLTNCANLLKYFAKLRKENADSLRTAAKKILAVRDQLPELQELDAPTDRWREQLMAREAQAARLYWKQVRALLPHQAGFQGRTRKGARDPVNSALNYGYGILYNRILHQILAAGLNPTVSFLHKPRRDQPTLTYDLIEEYRAFIVDRTVIRMSSLGEPLAIQAPQGKLTEATRRRLAHLVIERLHTPTPYRGDRLELYHIMGRQIQRLESAIQGNGRYRPFIARW
jgi:group II intron reverse transcriptase/maturase/CRISPR-associated endonuclease Cas1